MVDQFVHYGDVIIPYRVRFVSSARRKIAIDVSYDGIVTVRAPQQTSLAEIKAAVIRRNDWIWSHLQRMKQQRGWVLPREYVSGESHFYLGRRYVLKVFRCATSRPEVKLRHGQLQIIASRGDREQVKSLLWDWYKMHARHQFQRRLEALCDRTGITSDPPRWKLMSMKKQWGSCSPSGALLINTHLIKAPPSCIDYVLLHELCHLEIKNHSRQFYRLLKSYMPDWESAKQRLDGVAELLLNV